MKHLMVKVRVVVEGDAEGEIVVSRKPLSFLGDVDVSTSMVIATDSDACGCMLSGRILIMPTGRGSTVGSYIIYSLKKRGLAPRAIFMTRPDPVIVAGCVISSIPLAIGFPEEYFERIKTGNYAYLRSKEGILIIEHR